MARMFNREEIDKIKSSIDFLAVLDAYGLEHKKASSDRHVMKCPFKWHQNDTLPSLMIYTQHSPPMYWCFGCSRGGDIISFLQNLTGADFNKILTDLGAKGGKAGRSSQLVWLIDRAIHRTRQGTDVEEFLKAKQIEIAARVRIAMKRNPKKVKQINSMLEKLDCLLDREGLEVSFIQEAVGVFLSALSKIV